MADQDIDQNKVEQAKNDLLKRIREAEGTDTKPQVLAAVKDLKNSDAYTPAEKQAAFITVAREVVSAECDASIKTPGTLMRGKSSEVQFLAAYMEEHAQEYKEAVIAETTEKLGQLKIPKKGFSSQGHPSNKLDASNIPLPGMESDGPDKDPKFRNTLEPGVKQQWDDLYVTASKIIIDANNNQIDRLSPEAQEFLEVCSDVTREKFAAHPDVDKIVATQTANNCSLRLTSPEITKIRGASADPTEKAAQDVVFLRSAQVAQAYINRFNATSIPITRESEKALVAVREDEGLREKTIAASTAVSNGEVASYRPEALNIQQQDFPEEEIQLEPAQHAAAQQEDVQKKTSVRDMLRGAAGRVSSAASAVKASVVEKVDQLKLDRLEKQCEKREKHLENLKQAQRNLGNDVPNTTTARNQELKTLQDQYNPTAHSKGDPAQMDIADRISELKSANKLQERITKNESKLRTLEGKKEAQDAKIQMRAERKGNANKVEVNAAVKVG